MTTKAKTRLCKAKRKTDTGELTSCNSEIKNNTADCPKRSEHLHKLITGMCHAGWHEGTKAKDHRGTSVQVCMFWKTCPCQCHKDIDALYALSGQDRMAQENPEYIAPKSPYWVPTLEERALLNASSNGAKRSEPSRIESPMPEAIPATVGRSFAPTPTGRSGRGQLEIWVKEACDEWIVEEYKDFCSPSWVADWVVKNKGVGTQSQGAVNAVFERWIKINFARVVKKPTRFLGYTEEGIKYGLDALKLKAKTESKRKASAVRGFG